MISPLPIFSNMDYYKNLQFQECLRLYNIMLELETDCDELNEEVYSKTMKQIYKLSLEWLEQNKRKIWWRKDLT